MAGPREVLTKSLYLTACLASAMLWGAEGFWSPAALTLAVAPAAYAFVERRGLGISTFVANGLGLLAVAIAFLELALRDVEGRILFGAHLLVYLGWILLWQPKETRQRWGLIALSVLQVAVGAVLTTAGLYGLAMAAFLVVAVWTLIMLQVSDAEARLSRSAGSSGHSAVGETALLLGRGTAAPSGHAAFGRWSPRHLVGAAAVTTAGAAAVGGAFFLSIPRIDIGRHTFDETEAPLALQRVTGFTERVRLGAFGEILESSVPVFAVRIYDTRDDTAIKVTDYAERLGLDEPLFRGMALSEYESGEWTAGGRGESRNLSVTPNPGQIRQEYRLRPTATETLFAIAPVHAGSVERSEDPIRVGAETRTLRRPAGRRRNGELTYVVYSPLDAAAADQHERDLLRRPSYFYSPDGFRSRYLELPDGLDRLKAIAATVARPSEDEDSAERRADRLLTYLRDSGEFHYTLSGELIDPSIDPVEDFLLNRRAGHCEYFAAALALMLRAEGVPSRIVSGFKGGEANRLTGAFEVQQRHAHAWVEAYLNDRWVTLDPSPTADRDRTVADSAPPLPIWSDLRAAAADFWTNYVVQMNLTRQRQTLAPVRQAALAAIQTLREGFWPKLKEQVYSFATNPSRWFSWQGGVVTFVGLLIGVGLWRLGRRLKRRLARLKAARAERRRGRRVEFYERFRRLCGRFGWSAALGQTPREFAAEVTQNLSARPVPTHLAGLPNQLTEDFYRVRFGDLDLPESRVQELDGRLSELEAALTDTAASATR